jgi:hypothetical protein
VAAKNQIMELLQTVRSRSPVLSMSMVRKIEIHFTCRDFVHVTEKHVSRSNSSRNRTSK